MRKLKNKIEANNVEVKFLYSSGPNNSVVLNKCVDLVFYSPFIGENECFWENFKSY